MEAPRNRSYLAFHATPNAPHRISGSCLLSGFSYSRHAPRGRSVRGGSRCHKGRPGRHGAGIHAGSAPWRTQGRSCTLRTGTRGTGLRAASRWQPLLWRGRGSRCVRLRGPGRRRPGGVDLDTLTHDPGGEDKGHARSLAPLFAGVPGRCVDGQGFA